MNTFSATSNPAFEVVRDVPRLALTVMDFSTSLGVPDAYVRTLIRQQRAQSVKFEGKRLITWDYFLAVQSSFERQLRESAETASMKRALAAAMTVGASA